MADEKSEGRVFSILGIVLAFVSLMVFLAERIIYFQAKLAGSLTLQIPSMLPDVLIPLAIFLGCIGAAKNDKKLGISAIVLGLIIATAMSFMIAGPTYFFGGSSIFSLLGTLIPTAVILLIMGIVKSDRKLILIAGISLIIFVLWFTVEYQFLLAHI